MLLEKGWIITMCQRNSSASNNSLADRVKLVREFEIGLSFLLVKNISYTRQSIDLLLLTHFINHCFSQYLWMLFRIDFDMIASEVVKVTIIKTLLISLVCLISFYISTVFLKSIMLLFL